MEYRNIHVSTAATATPPTAEHKNTSCKILPQLPELLRETVQISLTIVYIVAFSFLFVFVCAQLWMIWYYRHKCLSYQTLYLFMCLIWSGLKITLFSLYTMDCQMANSLAIAFYWILYILPVCLKFTMLCLLLHFFLQILLKARTRYEPQQSKFLLHIFIGTSVLLFMAVNIVCAAVIRQDEITLPSKFAYMICINVALTETMLFVYGILLFIAIYKMTKIASMTRVLEAQGTTVCKALGAAILITLLFLSRTIYILVAICAVIKGTTNFGFHLIIYTDQADAVPKLSDVLTYVSFGIVLLVSEVLPISIVVILFRVKRLSASQVLTDFSTLSSGSRVFFFDNHHRSDSESDQTEQSESDYLDSLSPQTYIHNTHQSLTHGRAPIAAAAVTPQRINSSFSDSAVPSSSFHVNNKRCTNYGAVHGKGLPQSGTNKVLGYTKK